MVKKLLFILLICTAFVGFSQEKNINTLSAAPNPFTNSTSIHFNASNSVEITFTVKNVLGKTILSERITAKKGKNSIPFYRTDLSTGIYIYSIQDKKTIISKRLVIR